MTAQPEDGAPAKPLSPLARIPFYYGWVVVAIAFITMAIGVSVRSSFSLLFPPILAEFKWDRGVTAGIYSVGFLFSMLISPFVGSAMARFGPALVMSFGAVMVVGSLMLTAVAETQLHLFVTLGAGVVGGCVILAYIGHSYLLPFWFERRRGLAIGIAFSGVGVGGMFIFPWVQSIIGEDGWREACWSMALLLLIVVLPLNLFFQRRRPEDMGLKPDGHGRSRRKPAGPPPADMVVDRAWVERDWSLASAARTSRFWWLSLGYFAGMYAWYSVLIHQTKYLVETGFSVEMAAFALGLVGLIGVTGQISLGALSDRIGREGAWTLGCLAFGICYVLLFALKVAPSPAMVYAMVAIQGLGYGISSVYPSIMAELFHSRRYGQIFGALGALSGLGAAVGPWVTGLIFDRTGSYDLGWAVALVACAVSAASVWLAAPRKVRLVAGQAAKRAAAKAA